MAASIWSRLKGNRSGRAGGLQPVMIAKALKKEAQASKKVFPSGTLIPDQYTVTLSRDDYDAMRVFLREFTGELAGELARYARAGHCQIPGQTPAIVIRPSLALAPGQIRVAGRFGGSEPAPSADGDPPAAALTLRINPDTPEESLVCLEPGCHTIGRGRGADICILPLDRLMSKVHFSIEVGDTNAILTDLSSANGTRVNGRPAQERVELSDKTVITAGNTRIEVAV